MTPTHIPPAMRGRIESVFTARDHVVLSAMLDFYSTKGARIVDVTANRRKMWKGVIDRSPTFCDIDPDVQPDVVCDWSELPFENESVDVLVFDPPHLPSASGTKRSLAQYKRDYGLERSVQGDNISGQFSSFLLEARRVLRPDGVAFCKLKDFVHNHRYQWTLVDFVNEVRQVDGLTPCDLLIKRDPCGGNLKSGRWKKCHHARNVHCWWIVVRKGRCEPRATPTEITAARDGGRDDA